MTTSSWVGKTIPVTRPLTASGMDETFTLLTGSYTTGTIPLSGDIYKIQVTLRPPQPLNRPHYSFLLPQH